LAEDARQAAIRDYILKDPFARRLGATVEAIAPGYSRVSLEVTAEMVNFHGMTHGAVVFALSDIAFAAAGNSRGQTAVALNASISFLKATKPGDRLVAEARELHASGPTALYEITVTDRQTGDLVASSQDMVYRKREWFVPADG
jgi:acyl-CoA thioesterase